MGLGAFEMSLTLFVINILWAITYTTVSYRSFLT